MAQQSENAGSLSAVSARTGAEGAPTRRVRVPMVFAAGFAELELDRQGLEELERSARAALDGLELEESRRRAEELERLGDPASRNRAEKLEELEPVEEMRALLAAHRDEFLRTARIAEAESGADGLGDDWPDRCLADFELEHLEAAGLAWSEAAT